MGTKAVVGVTGIVGSRVADRLVAGGHDVVGLARDPAGAPKGVRPMAVDLTEPGAASRALAGAEAVYVTPPLAGADPLGVEETVVRNVIEAARETGVSHVVIHTALHADRGSTGSRILDRKTHLEEALSGSGVGYTILRPAWFLQNLFGAKSYLEQGMYSMPWPEDMVWAAIDVEDLAHAAAAFLTSGPANRGFDLHIPGGINARAICNAVEQVTGNAVAYQEAPGTREAVDGYPISEIHKELYAELFDYFKATEYLGDPQPITEAVDGFSYSTVNDFVRGELFPAGGS